MHSATPLANDLRAHSQICRILKEKQKNSGEGFRRIWMKICQAFTYWVGPVNAKGINEEGAREIL